MQSQGSVPQRRRSSPAGKKQSWNSAGNDRDGKNSIGVLRPASSNYFYYSRRSFGEESHMNWFYWNTAWSLFFSLVWFMTITHNPEARISDAHLRDEAFGG